MQFVDEFRDLFIDTLKLLLSVLDEGGHWDNSSSTSLIELEESYATYLEVNCTERRRKFAKVAKCKLIFPCSFSSGRVERIVM